MASIGTIGNKLDLLFRQGSSFGPYQITIKNAAGLPINLTGYTFSAKIKKSYSTATTLADIIVTPVNLELGIISISMPSLVTQNIKGNPDKNADYIWDMEYTDTNGLVEPLFYGKVTSFANA